MLKRGDDETRGEGRKWRQVRDARRYVKREDARGEHCRGGVKTRGEYAKEVEAETWRKCQSWREDRDR